MRLERTVDVVREHPRLQPEARVVHELERVLVGLVRADRHDRTEDLLAADLHLGCHVGQERRLEERTLARTPGEDLGALGDGLLDPTADPVDLRTLDHRSDVDRRIERIADLELLHLLREELGEPVVDVARDVHALDADAALSGLVVPAERDPLGGEVQIGVGVHDHAGVPAELERDALLRIEALQVPADLRGARETDLAVPLVAGHPVRDLRADGQDLIHALGQIGLVEELRQAERPDRRGRRRLHGDRGADAERGSHLVGDQVEREVERGDPEHGP